MPASPATDWPSRLFTLRRRRGLDQLEMGNLLGVTREWVSRLERGRGEFSELIQIKIGELERENSQQKFEHMVGEGPQAPYGSAEALEREVRQHFESILAQARGDVVKLGWMMQQLLDSLPLDKWERAVPKARGPGLAVIQPKSETGQSLPSPSRRPRSA